jgi:hypothetical protein
MDEHANSHAPAQANTADAATTPVRRPTEHLRYIPPVAALGTAFVLQVILVTDTVGTALANRNPNPSWNWTGYLFAALLGLAVASCVEGGAAYLMDLYDKHLLARDSVWLLRLGMLVYVGGSAVAVHWWTGQRGLPEVIGWILGGMSASALFLWSRGSRWKHRVEMRNAGQLDPALPRLSTAAKVLHPVRWLITLYLVSWQPVRTTDEARARYEQWRVGPHWWRRTPKPTPVKNTNGQTRPATPEQVVPSSEPTLESRTDRTVVSIAGANGRRRRTHTTANSGTNSSAKPTLDDLANTLLREHGPRSLGRPTAEQILRRVHGTCTSADAKAAKDIHNARLEQAGGDPDPEQEDSLELVAAGA